MASIVIVDDDASTRWVLHECLTDLGHLVHRANNGAEALRLLQRLDARGAKPDLLVTDFDMPLMNGRALIETCRADASLASIPVILCSGDMDNGKHAHALGVPFHLKFDSFKILVEKVEKALKDKP
jgi:CheY-like chemotaxis protein